MLLCPSTKGTASEDFGTTVLVLVVLIHKGFCENVGTGSHFMGAGEFSRSFEDRWPHFIS